MIAWAIRLASRFSAPYVRVTLRVLTAIRSGSLRTCSSKRAQIDRSRSFFSSGGNAEFPVPRSTVADIIKGAVSARQDLICTFPPLTPAILRPKPSLLTYCSDMTYGCISDISCHDRKRWYHDGTSCLLSTSLGRQGRP